LFNGLVKLLISGVQGFIFTQIFSRSLFLNRSFHNLLRLDMDFTMLWLFKMLDVLISLLDWSFLVCLSLSLFSNKVCLDLAAEFFIFVSELLELTDSIS
jgi:hypothetical protein